MERVRSPDRADLWREDCEVLHADGSGSFRDVHFLEELVDDAARDIRNGCSFGDETLEGLTILQRDSHGHGPVVTRTAIVEGIHKTILPVVSYGRQYSVRAPGTTYLVEPAEQLTVASNQSHSQRVLFDRTAKGVKQSQHGDVAVHSDESCERCGQWYAVFEEVTHASGVTGECGLLDVFADVLGGVHGKRSGVCVCREGMVRLKECIDFGDRMHGSLYNWTKQWPTLISIGIGLRSDEHKWERVGVIQRGKKTPDAVRGSGVSVQSLVLRLLPKREEAQPALPEGGV